VACKLLTDRKRPELDAIISIAFAAPLMAFSGTLYGGVLSVWGDPGTSKSTAQQVAAAVWGHPKQTRESLTSTAKSVQGRLGRTRNLPAYWDDIQDERHQEALFQTLFVATEGAEGGRLNTDASMKARLEWQTLLAACSNASFVEFLIKRQKSTTAGMRRVFEIEYFKRSDEPGMIDSFDAGQVFAALEHNYGAIGFEYAGILAREHKEIAESTATITRRFRESVNGAGDESYWWGMCGVLLAGAALACRLGAELDVPALNRFLQQAFLHNRRIRGQEGTEGGTLDNTERGLTAFLNFYVRSGNVLVVDKTYKRKGDVVGVLFHSEYEKPIYIQIVRDERKILISKRALREFLQDDGIHARQVFSGMEKWFRAKEVKLTLGAGTVHGVAQEICIELTVGFDEERKSVLRDLIVAYGPANPSA
jgi:phosphoheptose isomerase